MFDQDPDSGLHRALSHNCILSPHDICTEDDNQLDGYRYPTDVAGVTELLPRGDIGLLKSFKKYVAYQAAIGQPFGNADWPSITKGAFDNFRISGANLQIPIQPLLLEESSYLVLLVQQ